MDSADEKAASCFAEREVLFELVGGDVVVRGAVGLEGLHGERLAVVGLG